jgi:hypothetical protein
MSELSKIANEAYLANSVNEQMKILDVPKAIPLAADLLRGYEFSFYVIRP